MWIPDPLENRVFKSSFLRKGPLVGDEWIKASERTLNEIIAYQIGAMAGLSLPDSRCFLSRSPIRIDGSEMPEGSPVLLTKDISPDGRCLDILEAPCSDPMKALYLAFSIFDRGHEFPEIHIKDSSCFFLDLEGQFGLFPLIDSDIEPSLDWYKVQSDSAISSKYEISEEGGLIAELRTAARNLVGLIESRSWIDVDMPTPLLHKYEFIMKSIKIRTKSIKGYFGFK